MSSSSHDLVELIAMQLEALDPNRSDDIVTAIRQIVTTMEYSQSEGLKSSHREILARIRSALEGFELHRFKDLNEAFGVKPRRKNSAKAFAVQWGPDVINEVLRIHFGDGLNVAQAIESISSDEQVGEPGRFDRTTDELRYIFYLPENSAYREFATEHFRRLYSDK